MLKKMACLKKSSIKKTLVCKKKTKTLNVGSVMLLITALLTQSISRIQWLSKFDEFVIYIFFNRFFRNWQLTLQELYIKIDVPYQLRAKAFVARNRPW